jgi:hypothetical protein
VYRGDSKPEPNLAKSSQARPRNSKEYQRKRLGFPWILLAGLDLFNGLQRPPRPKKSFPAPFSLSAFAAARKLSLRKIKVARFLIFVKEIRLAFVMVGFRETVAVCDGGQSAAALA